eukprot:TRINITY_DN11546_c0_g1_i1.p1 TRINITY_DN11546_c0_g1~~TRINITY_DN11546_c0_g1_i1.p1  ORF type:complete len:342 (+),score=44.46 TRINITY_DN11546_c0_g1_i1:35-1060(+)
MLVRCLTPQQAEKLVLITKVLAYLGLLGLFCWYTTKAVQDYKAKKDTPVVATNAIHVQSIPYPQFTACTPEAINPIYSLASAIAYTKDGGSTNVIAAASLEPELSATTGLFCASFNKKGTVLARGAGFAHRLETILWLNLTGLNFPVYSSLRVVISDPGTVVTADMMSSSWFYVSPGIYSITVRKQVNTYLSGVTTSNYDVRTAPISLYVPPVCPETNYRCNIDSSTVILLWSFEELVVYKSEENRAATAEQLLGNISGMLSLLMGFSLMMIFDVFGFFLTKLFVVRLEENQANQQTDKELAPSLPTSIAEPIDGSPAPAWPSTPEGFNYHQGVCTTTFVP